MPKQKHAELVYKFPSTLQLDPLEKYEICLGDITYSGLQVNQELMEIKNEDHRRIYLLFYGDFVKIAPDSDRIPETHTEILSLGNTQYSSIHDIIYEINQLLDVEIDTPFKTNTGFKIKDLFYFTYEPPEYKLLLQRKYNNKFWNALLPPESVKAFYWYERNGKHHIRIEFYDDDSNLLEIRSREMLYKWWRPGPPSFDKGGEPDQVYTNTNYDVAELQLIFDFLIQHRNIFDPKKVHFYAFCERQRIMGNSSYPIPLYYFHRLLPQMCPPSHLIDIGSFSDYRERSAEKKQFDPLHKEYRLEFTVSNQNWSSENVRFDKVRMLVKNVVQRKRPGRPAHWGQDGNLHFDFDLYIYFIYIYKDTGLESYYHTRVLRFSDIPNTITAQGIPELNIPGGIPYVSRYASNESRICHYLAHNQQAKEKVYDSVRNVFPHAAKFNQYDNWQDQTKINLSEHMTIYYDPKADRCFMTVENLPIWSSVVVRTREKIASVLGIGDLERPGMRSWKNTMKVTIDRRREKTVQLFDHNAAFNLGRRFLSLTTNLDIKSMMPKYRLLMIPLPVESSFKGESEATPVIYIPFRNEIWLPLESYAINEIKLTLMEELSNRVVKFLNHQTEFSATIKIRSKPLVEILNIS